MGCAVSTGVTPDELRDRLLKFAVAVSQFTAPFLESARWRSAADQFSRAAAGAMSNYRAAGRARSHVEFTSKISLALEEIDEAQGWLKYLTGCGAIGPPDRERFDALVQECSELTAILTAAVATARRRDTADKSRRRQ
jgi:four helix bundle protein